MKRLILLFAFVYGVGLFAVAGWHLARAEDEKMVSWLLFTSRPNLPNPETHIYRIGFDGSRKQKIFSINDEVNELAVTQDGKWVVFGTRGENKGDIYRMRPDGSELQLLTQAFEWTDLLVLAPDQQWIFFQVIDENVDAHLYRMRLDGSQSQQLTYHLMGENQLTFTPDRQWVVFTGSERTNPSEIYRLHLKTLELQNLTNSPAAEFNFQLTLDGQWIIYEAQVLPIDFSVDPNNDIYRMRIDGTNVQNLSNHISFDTEPRISSDGKWIIFRSFRDGISQIYRMHLDGSQVENIYNTNNGLFFLDLSANGKWLIFGERDAQETFHISRIRLDGSQRKVIFSSKDGGIFLRATIENDWLIFWRGVAPNFSYYRLRFDGSRLDHLVDVLNSTFTMRWAFATLPPITAYREALLGVGVALMVGAVLVGRRVL